MEPQREIWVAYEEVESELEGRTHINLIGASGELDKVIDIVRDYITNDALKDWIYGDYAGPGSTRDDIPHIVPSGEYVGQVTTGSKKEFVDWLGQIIDEKIRRWLDYLNRPLPKNKKERRSLQNKQKGFEWDDNISYVFTKINEY